MTSICGNVEDLLAATSLSLTDNGGHIEFGSIGAYSLSGRTNFNGFCGEQVVSITNDNALPPK